MKLTRFAIPVALVFALAACGQGQVNKQTGGTLLGAGLGALAGSQVGGGRGKLAAVAIGALADRVAMQRTSQGALESNQTGQSSSWSNPDSGHKGTVTPTRTYQTASGDPCREYQQTVTIDGKTEQAYGRACRQPDGSWKIVN